MPTIEDQQREYVDRLTASPETLTDVRKRVRSLLTEWDMPELLVGDVELCASELVANVHRHVPDKRCELRLVHEGGGLILEVSDHSKVVPHLKPVDDDAESGRGIRAIHALATKWGWVPTIQGKKVVCTFGATAV